jgi:hypothetical protein
MIKLPFKPPTVLAVVCLIGISNCDICDLCKAPPPDGTAVSAEVTDEPGEGVLAAR